MRRPSVLCIGAVGLVLLSFGPLITVPTLVAYNGSASAPIGFYRIADQPISIGDLVFVRLPERVKGLVKERHYLPPDTPLIKRVAGLSGDEICREKGLILINGSVEAAALDRDGEGRKLPIWSGCRTLGRNDMFLLQSHPRSLDGRYFGPVDRKLVIGRAVKLRFFEQKVAPK